MKVICFDSYEGQCAHVTEEILAVVRRKPNALLCLAAGHTSLGVFDGMIKAKQNGADFTAVRFLGLDEWAGLGKGDDGSCYTFMFNNLFMPLALRSEQTVFFVGKADDLEDECERIKNWHTANGPIDYLLLGMGMNGHLALNEPGTSFKSSVHSAKLDAVTKAVGQKYFKKETYLEGGVTLGYAEFAAAQEVVLMVSGAHKVDITLKLLNTEPTEGLPASFIKMLPGARLLVDDIICKAI